eukprot:scaffold22792_cov64-Phaeocystis_antarctica.AAC.2
MQPAPSPWPARAPLSGCQPSEETAVAIKSAKGAFPADDQPAYRPTRTSQPRLYIAYRASAQQRHWSASLEDSAFHAGASHCAADRSKCAAASLSSAAERGPASQALCIPLSTYARMSIAVAMFGAARNTLADSALSPSSVHHVRLGHLVARLQPQHVEGLCRGLCPALRAHRIALLGFKVPLRGLHDVPRVGEHGTEVVVRHGLVGPQGDGLAVDLACSAPVLLRHVPRALSHQLIVRVARLCGKAGHLLRGLAIPLLRRPTILPLLPLLPQLLVKRPVQLPSDRVRRTVDAAEVRRRHLLIAAHVTDGVLLPLVVHV